MQDYINVIGAGLAGCEAAWQAAKRGVKVKLYEMKPQKYSPAHHYETFAELVCSNSLRSDRLENAVGLLKEEMRNLDSLIIKCADKTRIPAGGALAVDREGFSKLVTSEILGNENITYINKEVIELEENTVSVIASGPLTSEDFSGYISQLVGCEYLHFFDAAAPIVTYDSIDFSRAFKASRYGKGDDDYINCPMNKDEYEAFWNALVTAELAEVKQLDKEVVFEGCMPVETMAKRGIDTLRFGPLKPVGLTDPATGKYPYAVVQLRQDNNQATLYNIVGFQTRLKWPEQKRVFSMIPGLQKAEFVRYGVMHKNTFINSPKLLDNTYAMREKPEVYFAGQITGVEGYVESAASGLLAGINASNRLLGKKPFILPATTVIGSMSAYISDTSVRNFQPMNANFGLVDTLEIKTRDKKKKYMEVAEKSIQIIKNYEL